VSYFLKIPPAGAELFYADGQTDTMKLIAVFCNFVNTLKEYSKQVNKKNDPPFSVNLDPQLRKRKIKFHICGNTK
jgi:hypothetical protein